MMENKGLYNYEEGRKIGINLKMKLFKQPSPKTMKARFNELTDLGVKKNQQKFAIWCSTCDYLWFPIREWPRLCTCCKKRFQNGYNRVNKDGNTLVYFKGQKMLKDAFIGKEVNE